MCANYVIAYNYSYFHCRLLIVQPATVMEHWAVDDANATLEGGATLVNSALIQPRKILYLYMQFKF